MSLRRQSKIELLKVNSRMSLSFVLSCPGYKTKQNFQPYHRTKLKQLEPFLLNADGVIGIGITATAVGLIVGGVAAAMARKK